MNLAYGKESTKNNIYIGRILKGEFAPEDSTLPDKDLGKSLNPGFRIINGEVDFNYVEFIVFNDYILKLQSRVFGASGKLNLNEVSARELINPSTRKISNLQEMSVTTTKLFSKSELIELFKKIGHYIDKELADKLVDNIKGGKSGGLNGLVSFADFQAAYNAHILQNDQKI